MFSTLTLSSFEIVRPDTVIYYPNNYQGEIQEFLQHLSTAWWRRRGVIFINGENGDLFQVKGSSSFKKWCEFE